ncbi:MAG: hypothetical protein ACJ719_06305 [Nitrososphaeraceae archaeon]
MRILVVSGEYPPMKGGVGRYTYNLVNALKKSDKKNIDVYIVTNSHKEKANTNITSPLVGDNNAAIQDNSNDHNNGIYHSITKKGDIKNSDRLLTLVQQLSRISSIYNMKGAYMKLIQL